MQHVLDILAERGLLEKTFIILEEENYYLYRLHPALGIFIKERLIDAETVKENFRKSVSNFASIADEQIRKSPLIAQIASLATPDLIAASNIGENRDTALMNFRVGNILKELGLFDDAIKLLRRAMIIFKRLGHLKGISATWTSAAQIYVMRGNLDEAKKLYQQALEIFELLGDLKGKSTVLRGMAYISQEHGNLDDAMNLYQQSLKTKD